VKICEIQHFYSDFFDLGTSSNGSASSDYCCILCGLKEQSVERLKDHINLHFISQMKRPMPSSSFAHSPRSGSNGSASTNGSSDDGTAAPPEPKRVKTEPVLVSPKREDCDSAEQVSMLKNCLSFSLIHLEPVL